MLFIHFILNFLLITCYLLVFISKNPVYSVLFLILSFCNASAILFLFKVEFLALIFIIIYVGAIAVLFLFVVMMLNVKEFPTINIFSITFIVFGSFLFLVQLFLLLENVFFNNDLFLMDNLTLLKPESVDALTNIDVLGQAIFNYFVPCFLLAGFILLVAMIGAIVLTLNFNSGRSGKIFFRPLSRSDNFLSYFK